MLVIIATSCMEWYVGLTVFVGPSESRRSVESSLAV
jgi:hypothetical protein